MATEITGAASRSTLKPAIPRRRFHLLDAMILVAATALACGITVWIYRGSGEEISVSVVPEPNTTYPQPPPTVIASNQQIINFILDASFELILLTLPFFAMWTLALIPIRLRFPRPRLRRLARQPGMRATCAVGMAFFFLVVQFGILLFVFSPHVNYPIWGDVAFLMYSVVPTIPGLAVLLSWMTLFLFGRWRAEPSWVDRLGRVLGAYWIAVAVALPALVRVLSI